LQPALKFGGILKSPFPMDYSEADKSQSGKSLRHRITHTIYKEIPFLIQQKDKGVGSYEENLSSGMMSGKAFIDHDNFTGVLRLPLLESAIKGLGKIGARVFGKEDVQVPSYDVIYQMRSNDASIGVDLANRSMIVRLVKHNPDYKFKRSEHELIAYIEEQRELILASIFTVIKDWWKRGSPRGDVIEHTFPEFYAVMDWFCREAGLVSILTGHSKEQARIARKNRQWIRELALAALERKVPGEVWTSRELAGLAQTGVVKYPPNLLSRDGYTLERHTGQILKQEFETVGENGQLIRNGHDCQLILDDIQISRVIQKDDKYREKAVFNFIRSNRNDNGS
jgi:hypothetical protein